MSLYEEIELIHKQKDAFLTAFERHRGVKRLACKDANVTSQAVSKWLRADSVFAEKYNEIRESGLDDLEDEARIRAVKGRAVPVYYKGEKVDEYHEPSDDLLKFMLRAERPEKYANTPQVSFNVQLSAMTDEAIIAEIAAIRAAIGAPASGDALPCTIEALPAPAASLESPGDD